MPMPRLTTELGRSSMAARRAITLRTDSASGGTEDSGTRNSPLIAGEYCVPQVCEWCSGVDTTTQSTSTPGILTSSRG